MDEPNYYFPFFSRIDPNQTVHLDSNEYQLGLEAVREFSLNSYGTERCIWDEDGMKIRSSFSSPGSMSSSGFKHHQTFMTNESESTSFECKSWPNDSIDSREASSIKIKHKLEEANRPFGPSLKKSSLMEGRLFNTRQCF